MALKRRQSRAAKASALKAPSVSPLAPFAALPKDTQRAVAGRIVSRLRKAGYFGRGFYKEVYGPDQLNRRWTSAETGDELQALTASERNRLIALARNTERNSEHMEGILQQLELNVIADVGGKAVFTWPEEYEAAGERVKRAFARWASEAEYFDDASLQELLRLILRTLYIGGDLALVFDARITRGDSGQIITFEPDCIGNLAESDFKANFGDYSQHQGILKDANGKTVGVVVSWSQRGQTEYQLWDGDRRAAWVLIKPAGTSWTESPFTMLRNFHRVNQMRGSSPLWSGLGTISDGADLQGFEVQASKRNAQIMAQVTQGDAETGEGELAAELDPDAEAPINDDSGDEPIADEITQLRLDLDAIGGACGCLYDVLPPN